MNNEFDKSKTNLEDEEIEYIYIFDEIVKLLWKMLQIFFGIATASGVMLIVMYCIGYIVLRYFERM